MCGRLCLYVCVTGKSSPAHTFVAACNTRRSAHKFWTGYSYIYSYSIVYACVQNIVSDARTVRSFSLFRSQGSGTTPLNRYASNGNTISYSRIRRMWRLHNCIECPVFKLIMICLHIPIPKMLLYVTQNHDCIQSTSLTYPRKSIWKYKLNKTDRVILLSTLHKKSIQSNTFAIEFTQ